MMVHTPVDIASIKRRYPPKWHPIKLAIQYTHTHTHIYIYIHEVSVMVSLFSHQLYSFHKSSLWLVKSPRKHWTSPSSNHHPYITKIKYIHIIYKYYIYIYISPHQKHHWLVKSTPNKSPALRPKNSRPLEPPPPGWAAWLRWADRWCDPCSPVGARESRTSHRGCDILAISGTHGLEVPSIFSGPCNGIFPTRYVWLVVSTPLKNDGVRQLGWWHSQLNGKS